MVDIYLSIWDPASSTSSNLTRIWLMFETLRACNRQKRVWHVRPSSQGFLLHISLCSNIALLKMYDYLKRSYSSTCFSIILTYFQIISLTKLYNFWGFCPEKATMVPEEWLWPKYLFKNKNSHVFVNDIPLFLLVKVVGAAFFGWENQNILSPMPTPAPLGHQRGAPHVGGVIPPSWPGSSTDHTDPGRNPDQPSQQLPESLSSASSLLIFLLPTNQSMESGVTECCAQSTAWIWIWMSTYISGKMDL